jgi:hypothetical protein
MTVRVLLHHHYHCHPRHRASYVWARRFGTTSLLIRLAFVGDTGPGDGRWTSGRANSTERAPLDSDIFPYRGMVELGLARVNLKKPLCDILPPRNAVARGFLSTSLAPRATGNGSEISRGGSLTKGKVGCGGEIEDMIRKCAMAVIIAIRRTILSDKIRDNRPRLMCSYIRHRLCARSTSGSASKDAGGPGRPRFGYSTRLYLGDRLTCSCCKEIAASLGTG